MKALELTGKRYGRLTVLRREGSDLRGQSRWLCRCDCGVERVVRGGHLSAGAIKSCGCLNREMSLARVTKHGQRRTQLYGIHRTMLNRCNNPQVKAYQWYGAKGVAVCDAWRDFASFHAWAHSHGYAPGLSIDRMDNTRGYGPANCQWLTRSDNTKKMWSMKKEAAKE